MIFNYKVFLKSFLIILYNKFNRFNRFLKDFHLKKKLLIDFRFNNRANNINYILIACQSFINHLSINIINFLYFFININRLLYI